MECGTTSYNFQSVVQLPVECATTSNGVTSTCGIQPTSIVTMVMKVLHNIYNMCSCDLP